MKSESEIREANASTTVYSLLNNVIIYLKHLSHKYVAIVVFFVLWEILPNVGLIDSMFIPTPSTIAITMWDMIFTSDFLINTVITMSRVLLGFGIALLVAIPMGYLLGGYFKNFEKAVNPLINLLGQLNPWSFFHLVIVVLGIGELSIIFVVFYISQWPVLYNTVTSIKNVDPALIKDARVVGLGKFSIFWKVLLPASLPDVFAGMRLGAILAFFMVTGAEMMGAGDGLGYMVMWGQMYGFIPQMWVCIVTISFLGIIFVYVLSRLEKYFTSWKEDVTPL